MERPGARWVLTEHTPSLLGHTQILQDPEAQLEKDPGSIELNKTGGKKTRPLLHPLKIRRGSTDMQPYRGLRVKSKRNNIRTIFKTEQ